MQHFKLANILLDDSPQFLEAPTLICRSTAPFHRSELDLSSWCLSGPGEHDFTTFFNALSIQKWRSYTVASTFLLHLELRGGPCDVVLTRADVFNWDSEEVIHTLEHVDASEEWRSIDIELPVFEGAVIEGFKIQVFDNNVYLRNSYYSTIVDEGQIRDVELALCTTTFKKESFIERNIELVKKKILGTTELISGHFTQHVVDNGSTLDVESLQSERVRIYPNDNVGGSGGYARGMIEAMGQEPRATHVLLMDDDVVIQPESIIRTFNLLSLVDEEHLDDFISGAMMDLFEPDVRWEDTGYVTFSGDCVPLKRPAHVGQLHEVVSNDVVGPRPEVPGFEDQVQGYAGWWYCVIPVSQIVRNGLPLPVFVRYDDIEYALRCGARFMTMNGICLWHPSFVRRYNAAVERYQVTRNALIAQFTTDVAPMGDFIDKIYHTVQLELKKFNYTNAELVLDGFEDFLKGPEFIAQPGVAEQCFIDANRRAEKLVPFEKLCQEASELGIDLSMISDADSQKANDAVERRSFVQRLVDFVTFNGQRIDLGYVCKGEYAIVDVAGWLYPADRIRRRDTIVAVDLENQRGVIRHMDRDRFVEVWSRYKRDVRRFKAEEARLREEYRSAREHFTSLDFWRSYLGI